MDPPFEFPPEQPLSSESPRPPFEPYLHPGFWIAMRAWYSWMFGGMRQFAWPGGPMLSLIGDGTPALSALIAIVWGVSLLRRTSIEGRVLLIVVVHVAAVGLGNTVARNVYLIWMRPFAHPNFWGW